jgi:AcrR family transcriptional regulator
MGSDSDYECERTAARTRILDAMVFQTGERGFSRTTVSEVCARARVSPNTFYELFDGLQDCFVAVMQDGHRRARTLVCEAFEGPERWQDGLRVALASLLGLFDEEPLLARVWFVESLAAGSWALECRERQIRGLTELIVARWPTPEGVWVNPLAAAAVMESVLGIIQTRLLTGSEEPLVGLLGPLMGLIAAIYIDGRAAVEEMERGDASARAALAARKARANGAIGAGVEVPRALRDPRAHRARECLLYLAKHPGASNREAARALGIIGAGQISRLLSRLCALGLLDKHRGAPGRPNAWSPTPFGIQVAGALDSHSRDHRSEIPEAAALSVCSSNIR